MTRQSGCPVCSECDPESPHHWIDDSDTLTGFACKHCEATGVECVRCVGDGEIEDPVEDGETIACPSCGGLGIVEVVRADVVDGLIAAARAALDPAICYAQREDALRRLLAAIEKAERKPYRRDRREES